MRRSKFAFTHFILLVISLSVSFYPARAQDALPPTALAGKLYLVRFHPDGDLYVGDQVSIEVIPTASRPGSSPKGEESQVSVSTPSGAVLGPQKVGPYGIGGRGQATFLWAWDTSALTEGPQTLTFTVQPGGFTWTESVVLHPASDLPPPEPQARWVMTETACCQLYYITGTAAERDLSELLQTVETQAKDVRRLMKADFVTKMPIVLMPRVMGHGGFTTEQVFVSYLDDNYLGTNLAIILHHEMVHWLDRQLGSAYRPTIFVEGLAVYLSGGHFKPEPLLGRAAALLPPTLACQTAGTTPLISLVSYSERPCGLGYYLGLQELADRFYLEQHEVGYLEAGALVEFMVDTWGWPAFYAFYNDMSAPGSETQSQIISRALQRHFGLTFNQLEARFVQALQQQRLAEGQVDDVRQVVAFFNTGRRYQAMFDPSAYFLTAWMPDWGPMYARQQVADYLRRPTAPENKVVERLLIEARQALFSGDYDQSEQILAAVNAVLDACQRQAAGP